MAVSLETMNALNFLRETPLTNWLDYYVDSKKLNALFEQRKHEDSGTISQLLFQFVEQAQSVEKDLDVLTDKDFDDEDINYCETKAARLWLLALRCCAALKWDLSVISKHGNVLSLRALFDRLLKWSFPQSQGEETAAVLSALCSQPDWSSVGDGGRFASWLYARWVVLVDVAARFPDPLPRATVSNPQGQVDPNLAQTEALKAATANIRTLTEQSIWILRRFTTDLVINEHGLKIPLKECFQSTMGEDIGQPVFGVMQPVPVPRFDKSVAEVSSGALLAKTHYDLMCFEFAEGSIARAKQSLGQVLTHRGNGASSEYANIDQISLDGYCQAFGLQTVNDVNPFVAPINEQTSTILAADNQRKSLSMISRHLMEKFASSAQSGSTVHVDVSAENVVRSFIELLSVTARCLQFLVGNEANLLRFSRAIARQLTSMASSSGNNKTIMAVFVRYLCANIPGFSVALRSCLMTDQERSIAHVTDFVPSTAVLTPPPQPASVAALLSGGNDLWQLLLSYDSTEIKNLMPRISPFVMPARFNVPMVLGEEVLTRVPSGSHQEYITVLMSKLDQLAKLGKIAIWQANVNACVRELGPLGNDTKVQTTFTFEALRIELDVWHSRLHRTTDMRKFGQTTSELAQKVKGLMNAAVSGRMKLNPELLLPLTTFLINTSDWECIVKKLDNEKLKSPFVDLSKMFAAFAMTVDQGEATTRRVALSLWQVLLPTMEDSVQTKRAGNVARPVHREQNRHQLLSRRQLVAFAKNVKEQMSVSFLLSFLGKLFNCANGGMNRMFIQHGEFWPPIYDGSNLNNDFLNEMISLMIDNGLLINPNNAFYLRSKGDFLLAGEHYGQAMQVYMEALLACSDGLSRSFPDNVIDDSMWLNVMKCCGKMDCRTQEALVCQLMRDPSDSYLAAAKALEASVVYDASTAYLSLIFDSRLMEFAADTYAKMGQTHKVELVLRAMSAQDMNIHNVPSISAREVNRRKVRLLKIMCAHYFRLYE